MDILVKFPSRERPHKWFLCIKRYIDLSVTGRVKYLITIDEDDKDKQVYIDYCNKLVEQGVNLRYISGLSSNKIHAINRDMENSGEWDILVLASDDMECKVQSWDLVLSNEMESNFPDKDGVLWHWDGDANTKNNLNTMCILGRKYYERFNYIYHPDYISLFCDNEFGEVSKILGKCFYSEQVLFKHEHFSNNPNIKMDSLMKRTQSFYRTDEITYNKRKQFNFGL